MAKHDVPDFMTKDERNHLAGEFHVTGIVFLDEIFGGLLLFGSRGTQNVPFLVSHRQKSNYNA